MIRLRNEKSKELERLYTEGDMDNYTIKVHALKSSARIIGAYDFGDRAQELEDAGKNADIGYIKANNDPFIEEYRIPGALAVLWKGLRETADNYDYEGVLELIDNDASS